MAEPDKTYIDRLQRAFEMEETLADILASIAQNELPALSLPREDEKCALDYLKTLSKDTARHRKAVEGLLKKHGMPPLSRAQVLQRIRQMLTLEMSAAEVYADLSRMQKEPELKKLFHGISLDEKKHAAMEKAIIEIVDKAAAR